MVPTATSCGVRRNFRIPRLAIPSELAHRPADGWMVGAKVVVVTSVSLSALAGQCKEDFVEGRGAQPDVVDGGTGRVQQLEGVPKPVGARLDRHADAAGGLLDLRLAVIEAAQGGGHRGQVGPVAHVDLDDIAARLLLELGGRAGRNCTAVVD